MKLSMKDLFADNNYENEKRDSYKRASGLDFMNELDLSVKVALFPLLRTSPPPPLPHPIGVRAIYCNRWPASFQNGNPKCLRNCFTSDLHPPSQSIRSTRCSRTRGGSRVSASTRCSWRGERGVRHSRCSIDAINPALNTTERDLNFNMKIPDELKTENA